MKLADLAPLALARRLDVQDIDAARGLAHVV
jgi:hypothetical protein